MGEAPTFPANAKAIGTWFPAKERSLATSIFDAAAKLAPAVGVPLIGVVLLKVGWRWSFAFTGIVSFLYFVLFWKTSVSYTHLDVYKRQVQAKGRVRLVL